MTHRDRTTMEDEGVPGFVTRDLGGDVLALAICWCPDEPLRLGEAFLFPARDRPAVIGRGDAPLDGHDRALPTRQQPGLRRSTGPIGLPRLSRHQLSVRVTERALVVDNLGRARLLHDGRAVERAEVAPGDVLQVGSSLVLYCTRRPWDMDPDAAERDHRFAEADARGLVGESPAVWRVRRAIRTAALQDAHVLAAGPSGAGKELVAQGIHARSGRGSRPLVSRNAATFPETLIDAELFGNARNYPNAGMPERPGLIGEADGSTLFLDEIGELSDALQAHLLRVLDEGEYQRLGESTRRRSDFRFIGATRRDPEELRPDLLARMKIRIDVPGLGARREDIPLLARHLLRRIAAGEPGVTDRFMQAGHPRMSAALVRALLQWPYATHVRELERMLRASLAASTGNYLEAVPAFDPQTVERAFTGPVDPASIPPEVIQEAMDRHGGVQARVWRELGLSSRHALARLIKKHGIRS